MARHSGAILATARRFSIGPEDAEDAYQRGLEIMLTKAPTTHEDELVPWLRTVVKHEALAIRRQRERAVPTDELPDQPSDSSTDECAERFERLRRGAEAMGHLKPQEVRCLLLKAEGLSYQEICVATGFSYTKVNRCLTEGRRAFTERLASIESGAECERLSRMLSAFADGEATPEEETLLRQHLKSCLSCRALLREYRQVPATAAALLPIPLASAGGADRFAVLSDRATDWASSASASLKEHLSGFVARTPAGDPGLQIAASGARPGAMVATVAACVALGGGATYCAVDGIPQPVKDLAGVSDQADKAEPDVPEAPKPPDRVPPVDETATQNLKDEAGRALDQANSEATSPSDSAAGSSSPSPTEARDAAAQQEFGIEEGGSSSGVGPGDSATSSSSQPSASEPAPSSGGGGEFGP